MELLKIFFGLLFAIAVSIQLIAVNIITKIIWKNTGVPDNATATYNVTELFWDGVVDGSNLTDFSNIKPIFAKLGSMPVNLTEIDHTWTRVPGIKRGKVYVYSAFLDSRIGKKVKVIGIAPTKFRERLWCRFWNGGELLPARVKSMKENWDLKYSSCFIICPLDWLNSSSDTPKSISILGTLKTTPTNRLIINNIKKNYPIGDIGICVKPIYNNYDKVFQLLEFLELNHLLGATHITFYNHSISQNIDCIFQAYLDKKLDQFKNSVRVNVLDWNMDLKSQEEIRTEGMFSSLNDCLYRNMFTSKYLLFIDLDEFVIPKSEFTILEFLRNARIEERRDVCAIGFQNTFFYLNWNDESSGYFFEDFLVTQRKLRRRTKIHKNGIRSKYIVKPKDVVEVGNHRVWQCLPAVWDEGKEMKMRTLFVPSEVALLHHYRVCELAEGDYCIKTSNTIDNTTLKYGARLKKRFLSKYEELQEVCEFPDLEAFKQSENHLQLRDRGL